jgi:hypothetical protein
MHFTGFKIGLSVVAHLGLPVVMEKGEILASRSGWKKRFEQVFLGRKLVGPVSIKITALN